MPLAARALQWGEHRVYGRLTDAALTGIVNPANTPLNWDCTEYLGTRERGISSTRRSADGVDSVPALCTHRPSLLPIELRGEIGGLQDWSRLSSHRTRWPGAMGQP